jgi:hypothetical protein
MNLSNRNSIQNRAQFYRWREQAKRTCPSSSSLCVHCHTLRFKTAYKNTSKSFHGAKIPSFYQGTV